ncbi:MAG: nucleotide exchange factor GrpE [Corynebacterium sp.]|nr:nucleotide exchange factor GrpE [Corynebacterium sp.]
MTHPDNPGDPKVTDPEATTPEQAEAAIDEAQAAQEGDVEPEIGREIPADVEAELADIDAELAAAAEADTAEAAAEGETEVAADPVAAAQAELAERTEDLQRLNAEYTNFRRRTERDRQAVVETAKAQVLSALLPVLDDIDLARQHGDVEDGPFKAVADKLADVLKGQKLAAFGTPGDPFDPERHEAVQDLSTGGEQVIGQVLRSGYMVGDKLVRNAMVIIADPE